MPRSKKGRFISKKQASKIEIVTKTLETVRNSQNVSNLSENSDTVVVPSFEKEGNSDRSSTRTTDDTDKICDENLESGQITWKTGRRIVELDHLAKQLEHCSDCEALLNLSNTVSEVRMGFGSTLYIQCECGVLNSVTTNKSHRTGKRGPPVFDVNTKAAVGNLFFYLLFYLDL